MAARRRDDRRTGDRRPRSAQELRHAQGRRRPHARPSTTGEICGFLGANGSGKTTTIRMLCGLITPDSGGGTCLGLDIIRDAQQIRLQVGYMTQRFSYYEDLTVSENSTSSPRSTRSPTVARRCARSSSGWASRTGRTSWPASCRADGSSGWRSPPACCTGRSCCCSTSRRPGSTPRRAASSGT